MMHICCECGSKHIRILTRGGKSCLRWHTWCCECNEAGGDYPSLEEAVASCEAVPAQAVVGGVSRGGHVVEDRFHFHCPELVIVRIREVRELKLLRNMTERELMGATQAAYSASPGLPAPETVWPAFNKEQKP